MAHPGGRAPLSEAISAAISRSYFRSAGLRISAMTRFYPGTLERFQTSRAAHRAGRLGVDFCAARGASGHSCGVNTTRLTRTFAALGALLLAAGAAACDGKKTGASGTGGSGGGTGG